MKSRTSTPDCPGRSANGPLTAATVATFFSLMIAITEGQAQSYPFKPIRLVIPFPASGFSDILGRLVGQRMSESFGQSVVSDNRAGASGNIGAEIVAKAPPDGHTLLINSFNFVVNPGAMSLPFDPVKDFAPVSMIAGGPPLVLAVSAASPFKSVPELIAYARANPGRINFATSGVGTSAHLAIELLSAQTGVKVVQVPYKGSAPALTAVVSGEVAVTFPNMPAILPLIASARLRALAVTSAQRTAALPDVPTMAEAGLPGFEINGFLGLLAPAHTPPRIINVLHSRLAAICKDAPFGERLREYGMRPVASTPDEFGRFLRAEIAKWTELQRK